MDEDRTNPIFTQEEITNLHNFFKMYQKDNNTANLQQIIENLKMMEEFNTQIIIKILEFVRRKNKSYSLLKRYHFWELRAIPDPPALALGPHRQQKEVLQAHISRRNLNHLRRLKVFLLWTLPQLHRWSNQWNLSKLQHRQQKVDSFPRLWENPFLLNQNESKEEKQKLIY